MKIFITAISLILVFSYSCSGTASGDGYDGDCQASEIPEMRFDKLPADTVGDVVTIQLYRAKTFRKALPCDLSEWAAINPNVYSVILNEFLDDYTPEHKFVALRMMWSMSYNDNYSGDGFYADADDGTADFSGDLELIPRYFTVDGLPVEIDFGNTFSDGDNARKPVSPLLVEVLRNVIRDANRVLPPNQKIHSIEVISTTNGSHIAGSNHAKKSALDISKINGSAVFEPSLHDIVAAMQWAFDSELHIRENFGPLFKHKTFADGSRDNNFKVPGHFDHIHISVQ
ncbi:hypothetical protein [Flavobacterium pallidum]|uniref:Extensin-like C-terminal domain-containing protein n=1 Tax=Flavobacterium pallidum TaxID=2172098 RepID=A0A2S1SJM0_9FLAO|nr:hypothetical protein [Flavobacterium pallidum]AWI26608.1 hypothetical protein HYN49_12265 [Flavobacterium pallidum]